MDQKTLQRNLNAKKQKIDQQFYKYVGANNKLVPVNIELEPKYKEVSNKLNQIKQHFGVNNIEELFEMRAFKLTDKVFLPGEEIIRTAKVENLKILRRKGE